MRLKLAGLWQHPDFMRLWAGQTISVFGSQITQLALPLAAVMLLGATPAQMGVMNALTTLPYLAMSLLVGAWVDRLPRRPILIWSDIGRALVLAAIPVAWLLGILRMEFLYVVCLVAGTLTVFFDVAYQAFLPSLVHHDQLGEGNSKLQVTASAAKIAGPGLAGWVIHLASAPAAIFWDALSYLVSALTLGFVRVQEPVQPKTEKRRGFGREIAEGLRFLFGNPLLRSITACTAMLTLFTEMLFSLHILFAARELGLSAGAIGIISGVANVGFLLGALVARRLVRRLGLGRTIVLSALVPQAALFLIPLAPSRPAAAMVMLTTAQFVSALGLPIYHINQVSLRQAITPPLLQGRVNASVRFLVLGTTPLGALVSGTLATTIGLRAAMFVGALGAALAFLWVWFSPVWGLQKMPETVGEAG